MTHELTTIITIHDVMAHTLDRVKEIIHLMDDAGLPKATLLVSPGTGWGDNTLEDLHKLEDGGHQLAAHGWSHEVNKYGGVFHRLHSLFISRRAAEHLTYDNEGIKALMLKSHDWFQRNDFKSPSFYVPPAWAPGALAKRDLIALPYRYYEILSGIYDSKEDVFYRLPLAGFEADNLMRWYFLQLFNRWNVKRSLKKRTPLRIAIHPNDLTLRLSDELKDLLSRPQTSLPMEPASLSAS